jgi:macrodomain Ter protein organizer (MatP/YcbG family)
MSMPSEPDPNLLDDFCRLWDLGMLKKAIAARLDIDERTCFAIVKRLQHAGRITVRHHLGYRKVEKAELSILVEASVKRRLMKRAHDQDMTLSRYLQRIIDRELGNT